MYINCHTYYSLRYGTIQPKELLNLAVENKLKTLALTDINNTSACLDFVRLSKEKEIKPVLGVDFRNGAQQQFILLARTNDGFEHINTYLSEFLYDRTVEIPARSKFLNDTYVIYPYEKGESL